MCFFTSRFQRHRNCQHPTSTWKGADVLFPVRPESRSPANVLSLGDLGCVSCWPSGQPSPSLRPHAPDSKPRKFTRACLPARKAGSLWKELAMGRPCGQLARGQRDPSLSRRITHRHQIPCKPPIYDSWQDFISVWAGQSHFLFSPSRGESEGQTLKEPCYR